MAKKIQEVNQEVVAVRAKIDGLVEEVKIVDADIAAFEALYVARLEELEEQYQSKVMNLKTNRERLMGEISGYFDLAEAKETKTQSKLTLLSGDVIRKKATIKLEPNKDRLLEWAKVNNPDLVKTKIVESVDWAEYKKELAIQCDIDGNYAVMDVTTGEVLEAVEVVEIAARMEVK